MRTTPTFHRLFLIIAVLGLLLLTLPIAALVWRALQGGNALADEGARQTFVDAAMLSLRTSTIAMVIVVALGTPVAWMLARTRSTLARIADALVDLPILLPPAVAGIALLSAFGRRGVLGETLDQLGIPVGFTTAAVVIAQIFVGAPFYIRTVRAGFLRVDRRLEEAAADLGAPPWRVFRTITLPLARNAILAGIVLAWARALGEFGATLMFAGNRAGVTQTMPLAIYDRFAAGDLSAAIALSAVMLVISLTVLIVIRLVGESA